jgi:uncharacterized damage-inducible protein DinB
MSELRTLRDVFAHGAWANAKVFQICAETDPAQIEAGATGTIGTIGETLKHLVLVEDVYARMLRGERPETVGPRDVYLAHDLAWFAQRAARLGEEYAQLLVNPAAGFFDEPLDVPWFDFTLSKHDGLLQVQAHSAQHRAQVLSTLGDRGVSVPDVDFVDFVDETRRQPKE